MQNTVQYTLWNLGKLIPGSFGTNNTWYCTALNWMHWTVLCWTSLNCTALHCTALHCSVLCCTSLNCTALRCTALHCIVLHCAALHYTALQWTALKWSKLHCTTLFFTALHYIFGTSNIWHCTTLHCTSTSLLYKGWTHHAQVPGPCCISRHPHELNDSTTAGPGSATSITLHRLATSPSHSYPLLLLLLLFLLLPSCTLFTLPQPWTLVVYIDI